MLTIRNLTAHKISIKCIERFEDPNASKSKAGGYFFGSKSLNSASPSAPELGGHAQSFHHENVNVTLRPFESYTLSTAERNDGAAPRYASSTLRVTIELPDGVRHRADTNPSYTQKSSHKFTPLSPSPGETFTALFHPSKPTPHLSIRSDDIRDYSQWMQKLPDILPLSAISVPGSHNSHTHYKALPSVKCQSVDVKTQLENGIRFLDIRAQPAHASDPGKKHMHLVHGAFPISLTGPKYLAPILETCYAFLAAHPSETVLVSLKREGVGSSTDEHFGRILQDHYIGPNASKWYTDAAIPYLGSVRGKCVLVRRYTTAAESSTGTFMYSSGTGLDATAWPYNCTSAEFPAGQPTFHLQDFCEVLVPDAIAQKAQYANEHLVRAAGVVHAIPGVTTDATHPVPPGPLYLNFLSGSNFWKRACWPERIAAVVNRRMEEWLCAGHHVQDPGTTPGHPERSESVEEREVGVRRRKEGDGGTGIVVMDLVGDGGDWDLVRLIVGMNMGVVQKVREAGAV